MIDATANVSADSAADDSLEIQSYWMCGIGVVSMFFSWWQVTNLAIFAESISFKIKMAYFQSVLEKDASWFDENNPTEMSSKISKEIVTIQRGSGEKIG